MSPRPEVHAARFAWFLILPVFGCDASAPETPDAIAHEAVGQQLPPEFAQDFFLRLDPAYCQILYAFVPVGDRKGVTRPVYAEEEAEWWLRLPVEEIRLDSSGCFGTCPIYSMALARGGAAHFHGVEYVGELQGDFEGTVSLDTFARLCLYLDRFGFRRMAPSYTAHWLHDNTMTLSVRYAGEGEPVVVNDYGRFGPPELEVLIQAVEGVQREIDWRRQNR